MGDLFDMLRECEVYGDHKVVLLDFVFCSHELDMFASLGSRLHGQEEIVQMFQRERLLCCFREVC